MLRTAKNGCASIVYYRGKIVYHYWHEGIPLENLGGKQNKIKYIGENVDPENVEKVKKMMMDWELYEKGWVVQDYENANLFNYLSQMGANYRTRPEAYSYFKE
jgi:hypothetical protein